MKTLLKFDKVILVKELNEKVKKVGDAFEIANILDDAFVLREAKSKIAVGVVSFEDFDKHFVHEENYRGWTSWMPLTGFDGQTDAMYRTNRKKVQVKFITDKVRAEASCNKMDNFDLFFGVQIAYLRCLNKALSEQKIECEKKIKSIDCDMSENDNIMKKMIDSLVK